MINPPKQKRNRQVKVFLFGFIIFCFIYSCKSYNEFTCPNKKETVATISKVKKENPVLRLPPSDYSEYSIVYFYYNNGTRQENEIPYDKSYELGDKFVVVYDSLGTYNEVLTYKRIFSDSANVKQSVGEIIDHHNSVRSGRDYRYNAIKYKYPISINGKDTTTLIGEQTFVLSKNDTTLQIGKKFQVKYIVKNPQKVILYINNPEK